MSDRGGGGSSFLGSLSSRSGGRSGDRSSDSGSSSNRVGNVGASKTLLGDLDDVGLAEGVLGESSIETNDIADGSESLGLDHQALS